MRSDNDIITIKKFLLNNNNLSKLLLKYRIIRNLNNSSEDFFQDKKRYSNKYEFTDAINIKEKYLDKTLNSQHINYYENKISNSMNDFTSLINEALNEIITYLNESHVDESNIQNVINNYIDHLYVSLDKRIYGTENIGDIYSIDENCLFSNEDKQIIKRKLNIEDEDI